MTETPPHRPRRVLLIGWDAADWQMMNPLLEARQMPNLERLINGGVMGNLATLFPIISPMLWNSIATGKTADKHGVLGFTEPDPAGGIRPFASTSRRTKAIWNIFQQALGWRCNVIGWLASHPAEPLDGIVISDLFPRTKRIGPNLWNVPKLSVHPEELAAAFGPMRMSVNEITEHLVLPFIPRAAEIDQKSDPRLGMFASVLSDACTIQAAATAAMETGPWDFTAVYFDAIDHFSHGFMPFHPPRQEQIPERDFEIYREVMNGAYRFHDLLLGRLVELAGPDALIVLCSDHGFKSGVLRPIANPHEPAGPILWHRDYGMLVLHGPGVKQDERVYGASLLDLTPTLLTLCGLPVGEDMDGKPLLEALVDHTPPPRIPSWDAVEGRSGMHPAGFTWEASPEASRDLMKQFAALGYIDDPGANEASAVEGVALECRYNLSQVHLSAGRPEEAVTIMEDLVRQRPWESRFIHQLANAYLKAEYFQAATDLLARAYPPEDPAAGTPLVVWIMRAKAHLGRGERNRAAQCLALCMRMMLRHPHVWVEAGRLWLELRRYEPAEACFRRALELDPDNAPAWQALSTIHVHRHENGPAIDCALEAVARLHHLPVAHFNLGVALAREERFPEAVIALRRAVGMQPKLVNAHRWLAVLHAAKAPDSFLAGVHRNAALQHSRERGSKMDARRSRADEVRPIPDLPSPAERAEREHRARPGRFGEADVAPSGRTFTLVSGLPRSGTSLMMQMLAAGGLAPQTDGERRPDADNPEGYLEWEAIKRLPHEPAILDAPELERRALKIVSPLLNHLPREHRYRVIFMCRPVGEVARSQAKMIGRRGTAGLAEDEASIAAALHSHVDATLQMLRGAPTVFDLLEVDYPALVRDPAPWAARIAEFLGSELLPHAGRMAAAVRPDLHRNRPE